MQQQHALLIFVWLPIVYTVGFFGWCYGRAKAPIFSKRNSRSQAAAICGHLSVILILIMLAQMASRLYPLLPSWVTDTFSRTFRGSNSVFGIFCLSIVLAIAVIEKRWIYVDSGAGDSESKGGPS